MHSEVVIPYVQQLWEKQQADIKRDAVTAIEPASLSGGANAPPKPASIPKPGIEYPKQPPLDCPNVDLLRYWREPSESDWGFETEYMRESREREEKRKRLKGSEDRLHQYYQTDERYVTFEPDHGGWNNIRYCRCMRMYECLYVCICVYA